MKYSIKAIPTTYAGVNFRSRLEARWAAFFDLCGWDWDYEPFDLEGWAPDFLARKGPVTALVEVKPFDLTSVNWGSRDHMMSVREAYQKVQKHWDAHQVLMLGTAPMREPVVGQIYVVGFTTALPTNAAYDWDELVDSLTVYDAPRLWREAGNAVQWQPRASSANQRTAA